MIASAHAAKKITRASSGSSWLDLGGLRQICQTLSQAAQLGSDDNGDDEKGRASRIMTFRCLCFPPFLPLNTFVFHPRSHVMDCPGHGPAAGQMSQLMHLSSLWRATIPLTASAKPLPSKVRLPTKQYRREARGCDFGLDVCLQNERLGFDHSDQGKNQQVTRLETFLYKLLILS